MVYVWLIAIGCILWYLICEVFDTIKSLFTEEPKYESLAIIIAVIVIFLWVFNKGIEF